MTSASQPPDTQTVPKRKPRRPPKARLKEKLTELQVSQLHARTLCSPSTIRRWAKGYDVTASTMLRLGRAADAMGIEVRE